MKSCETHTGIEKGLLQNGEVLQQPLPSFYIETIIFILKKGRKSVKRY